MGNLETAKRYLPEAAKRAIRRLLGRGYPSVGQANFGDFARTQPISKYFGYDRGTPIDRYYIENFLAAHSADIRGRVLEIGDATYSDRFGSAVTQQDVLHVHDHPEATIVGDLSKSGVLPESAFDCMILTQTLHLIYDMPGAVRELKRALKPGGVVLITVPGVSSIDRGEWGGTWYWALTEQSARRLFGDVFGSENVDVHAFGNVYAAICFLHGLALEDVDSEWLEKTDGCYPVTVAIRAVC